MLAGLLCDEVQRNQRRVGHRIVQVPDDLRDRLGVLLRADHLHDVLGADGGGGLRGHVDLGVALAFEAGGEGQQIRVVALSQRCDGGGVDAAGEEGADSDIRTHVFGYRVL